MHHGAPAAGGHPLRDIGRGPAAADGAARRGAVMVPDGPAQPRGWNFLCTSRKRSRATWV